MLICLPSRLTANDDDLLSVDGVNNLLAELPHGKLHA